MANWQHSYIVRKQSESGQTGTATYDLPERDVLGSLLITAFSTPTASTDPALPLVEAITKIEVIDGGRIIQSISGHQAKALMMFRGENSLSSTEINDNAAEGYDHFLINFGRFVRDTKYGLNLSALNNPQIRLTWDYSLTTGFGGATFDADTSPAMKFSVLADILRGSTAGYTGSFIQSSEIYSFTSAASAVVQVEIPRGQLLYGIMVQAGYTGKDWTEDVEQIKLDLDNGSFVPFHLYEEEIVPIQRLWHGGDFEVDFVADLEDDREYDLHMGYIVHPSFTQLTDDSVAFNYQAVHQNHGKVGVFATETPAAITAYTQVSCSISGQLPYNCWYAPMSAVMEGETLDTTQYGRINLEITQGSAVSTSSKPKVVAEYIMPSAA